VATDHTRQQTSEPRATRINGLFLTLGLLPFDRRRYRGDLRIQTSNWMFRHLPNSSLTITDWPGHQAQAIPTGETIQLLRLTGEPFGRTKRAIPHPRTRAFWPAALPGQRFVNPVA
jgi:hypothetical protein